MFKKLLASAFMGLGFFVVGVSAQQPLQPPANEKKADTPSTPTPGQPPKGTGSGSTQKADPTDALVRAALANDPDVKLAQAKIQLAEAEMAKARQGVVLKVMTLNATIKDQKSQVEVLKQKMVSLESLMKSEPLVSQADLLEARITLERAANALAKSELELKLITGGIGKEVGANTGDYWAYPNALLSTANQHFSQWALGQRLSNVAPDYYGQAFNLLNSVEYNVPLNVTTAKGPIPDRIRASLDKTVKLGAKGEQVTFAKALEVFKKDAGLDVPVREVAKVDAITSEGEELPVGAWFQLFADNSPGTRFLVREYGLLVTMKDAAPPDALPLMEFWKQAMKKAPEPKAKPQTEPGKQ